MDLKHLKKDGDAVQRAEAAAKAAKEKAEAETAFLAELGAVQCKVPVTGFHLYQLYGRKASIEFGAKDHYSQRYEGVQPLTWGDVFKLIQAFPPVPAFKVADGCTSFRNAEGIKESERANVRCTITELFPVMIEHEPAVQWPAWLMVTWFSKLPTGSIVEVEAYMPRDLWPAESNPRAEYSQRSGVLVRLNCSDLKAREGVKLEHITRYGGGGPTGPNRFVMHWNPRAGDAGEVLARDILGLPVSR